MRREKGIDLPADLERVRARFARWRRTRKHRTAIPGSLWTSAAEMARRYGVNRVARALRVDYYSLKKRSEDSSLPVTEVEPDETPAFLELAMPAGTRDACECVLELKDETGATLRLELKGVASPDLAALTRSFGRAES